MVTRIDLPLVVASILLVACNGARPTAEQKSSAPPAAPRAAQEPAASQARAERAYVLILLRTGPKEAEVRGEARDEAIRGHFANIQRLSDEGSLLVAGPFAKPMTDTTLRGLFLFDVAEIEDALELAGGDPTLQGGILVADPIACTSTDPVRRSHELYEEMHERGEEPPMASYVIAVGEPSEAGVAEEAGRDERVVFTLRCQGSHAGERILLLDVREPESAVGLFESHSAEPSRWALHPWLGTSLLSETR